MRAYLRGMLQKAGIEKKVSSHKLHHTYVLSTGQKFQQAEEINPAVGPVEDDGPDEVEAMAEDGFEGALESFFKGIGCRSARACPVR